MKSPCSVGELQTWNIFLHTFIAFPIVVGDIYTIRFKKWLT